MDPYLERQAGEDEHEVGGGEAGEEHADRRGLDVRVARHRGQDERVAHDPQHEGHRVHGQGGTLNGWLDGWRGSRWRHCRGCYGTKFVQLRPFLELRLNLVPIFLEFKM